MTRILNPTLMYMLENMQNKQKSARHAKFAKCGRDAKNVKCGRDAKNAIYSEYAKPNLPNQTHQIKPNNPNLPNKLYPINPTKPNLTCLT